MLRVVVAVVLRLWLWLWVGSFCGWYVVVAVAAAVVVPVGALVFDTHQPEQFQKPGREACGMGVGWELLTLESPNDYDFNVLCRTIDIILIIT